MRAFLFVMVLAVVSNRHIAAQTVLRGTVERVDQAAKRIAVANEPIPGGMGAMTMEYAVEPEAMLSRLKPGDRITAKLYGGSTLREIETVPAVSLPGMGLEELERIALANNPTLGQTQAAQRAAAGLLRQSGLYPNPTVGYYGDEIRGGSYGGGKQGGFISQTLVTGGKRSAARRVAQLSGQQAETVAALQKLQVVNSVRLSFYRVLANQRLVEVKQRLAKLAADATETAHQLANIGQADRPDVLQAEVEQQQVELSLKSGRRELSSAWRVLATMAGKPDLPEAHVNGDLEAIPDLNYGDALATALREDPEIQLAQQRVERSEASLVQAKRASVPDLQISANFSQNQEPLDTTHKPVGFNGGAQIGVQVPLFDRNQGNILAAKAETEGARNELARVKLQLARDLAERFGEYDTARLTAQQYKTEILPRSESAYQLYRTNYQNMAGAYPQTLLSQRTLFQLEVDYILALEKAWNSALGILGFGLTDGLASPLRTGSR